LPDFANASSVVRPWPDEGGGYVGHARSTAWAHDKSFDECPEPAGAFVVVMKNQRITDYVYNHSEHDPSSSGSPDGAGENLSSFLGRRCASKVASTEWVHLQGSSPRRESWQRL